MRISQFKRKYYGWLSYAFASEVFVIVSLTLFLPICLEQFARDNGYLYPEKMERCSALRVPVPAETGSVMNGSTSTNTVMRNSSADVDLVAAAANARCVVKIGWVWIDTASFSLYVFSLSVLLQALTVISLGGIADLPSSRKSLLLGFGWAGALSATLFLLIDSTMPLWWFVSGFLAVIANVGFGVSVVAMNAYLPMLARENEDVRALEGKVGEAERKVWEEGGRVNGGRGTGREAEEDDNDNEEESRGFDAIDDDMEEPLLPPNPQPPPPSTAPIVSDSSLPAAVDPSSPHEQELQALRKEYTSLLTQTTSRISSTGIALGYFSGIFLLIMLIAFVIPAATKSTNTTFALRLAISLSGIWWGVFSVPAGVWLPGGSTRTRATANESGNENESGHIEGYRDVEDADTDREALLRHVDDREVDGLRSNGEARHSANANSDPDASTTKHRSNLSLLTLLRHVRHLRHLRSEVAAAWRRLFGMLRWKEVKNLRNTFRFLGAWFLLSDAFTTITSTALLFAKTSLLMPPSSLVLIGILVPSSGILGSLFWVRVQRWRGWSNLRVLVTLLVLASLIPGYGCLGFLPIFRGNESEGGRGGRFAFGGLTTPGEMFALAIYFGFVLGAFNGYARAFYAEFLPPGEEARWFGLFSITDKSSSFIGPLVVGLIADTTGNIRYAFFFLVIMVWAAIPVLMSVDVEKGRRDAKAYVYEA